MGIRDKSTIDLTILDTGRSQYKKGTLSAAVVTALIKMDLAVLISTVAMPAKIPYMILKEVSSHKYTPCPSV